jgi:hypothetical protein
MVLVAITSWPDLHLDDCWDGALPHPGDLTVAAIAMSGGWIEFGIGSGQ